MDRAALYVVLQTALAGEGLKTSLEALCDSLAAGISLANDTPEGAHRMARALAEDMVRTIDENWHYTREVRAQTFVTGGA